ncbi:hypothetical protein CYMTET_56181 [Cymbomonas tetramitiformis]|uniref:N-alpha-acetyltransferase 60 n=1 Tax=Cymbomonas tetramitiformis TaxID=36881 RepID=A0AAE0BCW2_9CHLO|nr:hypothetical protein CYMTET_56181 [Cymbomonas tetramitiformis]
MFQPGVSLIAIPPGFYFRQLRPSDIEELKELHRALFPIDYEHEFYEKAVNGRDGIIGWILVDKRDMESGEESVAGFVTVRVQNLEDCDEMERELLGWTMLEHLMPWRRKGKQLVYILTLGVKECYRKSGLGRALIQQVQLSTLKIMNRTVSSI